jgi:alkylated DNA nucleotide flippase Atl1
MKSALERIVEVVQQIPAGFVASYGDVGRRIGVSGLVAGRLMSKVRDPNPWWRVIGSDGGFPITKKDPNLFEIQTSRLRQEGIGFLSTERADIAAHRHIFDE